MISEKDLKGYECRQTSHELGRKIWDMPLMLGKNVG